MTNAIQYWMLGILILGAAGVPAFDEDYPGDAEDGTKTEQDSGPPPKIVSKSQIIHALVGDNVTFPCEVQNSLRPSSDVLMWTDGREQTLFIDSHGFNSDKFGLSGHNLVIYNVQPEDQSKYTCRIPLLLQNVTHTLIVSKLVPAEIAEISPKGEKHVLRKGDSITLSCNVTGSPSPVVTWTKEDPSGHQVLSKDNTLVLKNVGLKDSGVYQCSAFNKGNKDPSVKLVTITVQLKSSDFVLRPENPAVYAINEDLAELSCFVEGYSKVKVTWLKGTQKVSQNGHYVFVNNGNKHSLRINGIKVEDFGDYLCVGTAGETSVSETIKFMGVPTPPKVVSSSSGNGTAMVSWIVESGVKIKMYEVSYMQVQDKDWKKVDVQYGDGDIQHPYYINHTFTDLPNGVYHTVLRVQNQYGWSPKSEPHAFSLDKSGDADSEESKKSPSSSVRSQFSMCLAFVAAIVFARHYC